MSAVIALAGLPASGKTTVARALSETLRAPRVSFGELVRTRAREQGLPDNRTVWQEVGSQLLAEHGPDGFIRAALAQAGLGATDVPVVWDGVRHMDVVRSLRALYRPQEVLLVVLRPPEEPRRERFLREAGTIEQLRCWERHETEQHVAALAAAADLVCDHPSTDDATSAVLARLGAP